jgi:hypothetical protein
MKSVWTSLEEELRARDSSGDFAHNSGDPVDLLVNGGISAKPYQDILISYLDSALPPNELQMVIRALSEKGVVQATGRLLCFFEDARFKAYPSLLWAVGNAVHAIAGQNHLRKVLAVCRRDDLGGARQMLVLHLARFKDTDEVFQVLISLLDDETVRGHALEALWRYGDTRALSVIGVTPVRDGLYEAKAKATALRRLQRKLDLRKAEPSASANGAPRRR